MSENIFELVKKEKELLEKQQKIYMRTVSNINIKYSELITDDLGSNLVKNCALDIAGEVVRRFFDTSDYYITIDQLAKRIITFSYDNEYDPLDTTSEEIRKNIYNINDNPNFSKELKAISKSCKDSQQKLFNKVEVTSTKRETGETYQTKQYEDLQLMTEGKAGYRETKEDSNGNTRDELSGVSDVSEDIRNEVDHVQAAATAMFNARYINTPEAIEELKKFYNSDDNFQMLEKRANESKGDVRVFSKDDGKTSISEKKLVKLKGQMREKLAKKYEKQGLSKKDAQQKAKDEVNKKIEKKYTDITYKASASQVADAVCDRWENANEKTKEYLKKTGKLDENGKVPPEVRKKLEENLRKSMNEESIRILKVMDKKRLGKDALESVHAGLPKIVSGQIIYYTLPPLLYETRCLLQKPNLTLEQYFEDIEKAGKRIINYVTGKLTVIASSIAESSIKKLIKTMFDILIALVKETVKKITKILKEITISLIQCIKIISSPNTSGKEKADAISRCLGVTITTLVLEVVFEYMEKQFCLPDIVMEPLQIIATVLCTNIIMLILDKVDLFDVRYGLLTENINKLFNEERDIFESESNNLISIGNEELDILWEKIQNELDMTMSTILQLDYYVEDATESLNKLNEVYDMKIDFETEWNKFCMS